jgi:hypothetical protein
LNSTLKCNSKTGCRKSEAAVGFVLFPPSIMRSTKETVTPKDHFDFIEKIEDNILEKFLDILEKEPKASLPKKIGSRYWPRLMTNIHGKEH